MLFIFLFIVIYLPVSILIVNAYFFLRIDNQRRAKVIHSLKSQLNQTQKDLLVSNQHLDLLKTFIEDIETGGVKPTASSPPKSNEVKTAPRAVEASLPDETNEDKEKEGEVLVDVQEMIIKAAESKIGVEFKLVNIKAGTEAVKGYVHLMAMADRENVSEEQTYPREKVENGNPVNYRRGLPFFIERFKPYNHEFQFKPGQAAPTTVRVLVYDQSGSIILDKEFVANNAS